jgi:hypothetical protein
MKSQKCIRETVSASVLIGIFSLCVSFAQAQTQDHVPQPPTSATDGKVKVHGGKFFHRNRSLAKKLGGQASSTEHAGKAFRKPKSSAKLARESRVFKRQNQFSRKEKSTTARRPKGKKPQPH